ncbi:MAG: AIPR family protein [Spirochaetales bacterium]
MAKVQIQVEQITSRIRSMLGSLIDISDLGVHQGTQQEDQIITRTLAAYGILWNSRCTLEEAAKSVTDGTKDNGIDAIYYNQKNQRITLVQSKYIKDGTSEPAVSDIRTFRDGIYDLLEGRYEKFNDKIKNKKSEIDKIKEFGTKIDIILIHTGKDELADPATELIDDILLDLNGEEDDGIFSFITLSKKRIVAALASSLGEQSIDLEFALKDYGMIKEPFISYYGKISGEKLQEWWNLHKDLLFRDNIRNSLGNTIVNSLLAKTINESPELFWYFNNGITLIADSVEKSPENGSKRDFGIFRAKNASIVNGAQTYSTIGKNGAKGIPLDKIEVQFRAIQIEKDHPNIKQEITRYNNTQNTILPKDFLAQDPIQVALKTQFSIIGYNYIIKRDDNFQSTEKMFDIDEAIEAMVLLSDKPTYSAFFKKEIGRFYNTDSALYKSIFNETTNTYFVVNAIRVLRSFKKDIKTNAESIISTKPDLERVNGIVEFGTLLIGQIIYKKMNYAEKNNFDSSQCSYIFSTKQINEGIEKVAEFIARQYHDNYLVTLFQNSEKCSAIYNSI